KKINTMLIIIILIFIAAMVFLLSVKEPMEYRIEHMNGEEKTWKYTAKYIDNLEADSLYSLEFDVKSSLENPYSYGVIIRSYNTKDEPQEVYRDFKSVGSEYEHKQAEFKTLDDTDRILLLFYNYETDSYTAYKDIVIKDSTRNIVNKIERFKYIPDVIANRLMNINLKTENASLRIHFTNDGLKLFKDHALLGAGGGAWKNLYRQYQSLPYNTTEAHNFYIQYAVEVGLLGLFVLATLLVQLAIGLVKSIKNKSNYLPIYLAVLLILLHSTIDFNLSLSAAAYILWVLIGVSATDSSIIRLKMEKTRIPAIGLLIASIIIVLMSSSIYYGIKTGDKAAKLIKADKDKAIAMYEKAMRLDRFNAAYRIDYAQIISNKFRSTKDVKDYNNVLEQIGKINKHEPYNSIYTSTVINLMLSNGLIDEAVSLTNIKVQKEPMVAQWYIQKIEVNYEIAKYLLSNNQQTKAIPYLENMIEVKEEYEKANARALKPIKLPQDYDMKTDLANNWIEEAHRIESKKE
ncbi:O-antigen ligase family protein, partial [Lutispora sp.]|uniref:O-antigen ligase family protein n=1 Tax=Lutispora sp. TaxID=2828727 RepID=UPI002B1EA69D